MWELRAFIPWEHRFDAEKALKDKSTSAQFRLERKRSDLYIDLKTPFLGLKFRDIPESPAESKVLLELKIQLKHNSSVEKWWKCVETYVSTEAIQSLPILVSSLTEQLSFAQKQLLELQQSLHQKSIEITSHHHSHKPSIPYFKKKIQKQIYLCANLQKAIDLLRSDTFSYEDSVYETRKVRSRVNVPVVELLPPHLIQKKKNPSQIKKKYLQKQTKHNEKESKSLFDSSEFHPPINLAESAPRIVSFECTELEVLKKGQLLGKYQTMEFEGLKPKLLVTCLSSLDFPFCSSALMYSPNSSSSLSSTILSNISIFGYPEFIQHFHQLSPK